MMAKKENGDDESKFEQTRRSLTVGGHKTSVSLEDALWKELRAVADERNVSVSELVNRIDIKGKRNLSSAIRQFVSNTRRKRR